MSTSNGSKYFCHVCQINLACEANYVLHEFNDKHCENLLKVAKNKQIKTKTAKPVEVAETSTNNVHGNSNSFGDVPPVNPSLYGYFQTPTLPPKEFNNEYDPYLQKLADNPNKPVTPTPIVTNFTGGKKKKKRYCELCEVFLNTIPEYEAHMKSSAHVYKLKMLGMGVSAHFVKASTDLHTTDFPERPESESADKPNPLTRGITCETCHLVLNSKAQFDVHVSGKTHLEKLKKIKNPQQCIMCYTCNVQLAGMRVYNDHKAGKKHRNKCVLLARNGFTIPPEERTPEMANWKFILPVKYPELYVKCVVSLMEENAAAQPETADPEPEINEPAPEELMPPPPPPPPKPNPNLSTGMYHCSQCSHKFSTSAKMQLHSLSAHNAAEQPTPGSEPIQPVLLPPLPPPVPPPPPPPPPPEEDYSCHVCEVSFKESTHHWNSKEHAEKMWEQKMSGIPVRQLVDTVMKDRKINKPVNGRYHCGFCDIIVNNEMEYKMHLESMVHKVAEKAYAREIMIVLQESVARSSDGTFRCTSCNESWPELMLYNNHVLSKVHSGLMKEEKRRRIIAHSIRMNNMKNPGFRTKISGLAMDVNSGTVERVPNTETLEPKIDGERNVNLGITLPELEKEAGGRMGRMRPPVRRPRARYTPYPPSLLNLPQTPGPWPSRPYGPGRFQQPIPPGPWQSRPYHPARFQPRPRFPPRSNMRQPWHGDWGQYPC